MLMGYNPQIKQVKLQNIELVGKMKAELLIDSLKALISNFETSILKLINKKSLMSHKIEDLSLNLLSFKSDLLKSISTILKSQSNKQLVSKLQTQRDQNREKLKKLQLHALLRKKIKRIKKQSMLHSISEQSFSSSIVQDPNVAKLRNSMMLIEKDLGIHEDYDNYEDQISSVVHKSMNSLEVTPIKGHFDSNTSDVSIRFEDQYVLPQNYQINGQKPQIEKKKQEKLEQKQKKAAIKSESISNSKVQPKKKKVVYTANQSKGGMLDNLLEQSLQSYVQGDKK